MRLTYRGYIATIDFIYFQNSICIKNTFGPFVMQQILLISKANTRSKESETLSISNKQSPFSMRSRLEECAWHHHC